MDATKAARVTDGFEELELGLERTAVAAAPSKSQPVAAAPRKGTSSAFDADSFFADKPSPSSASKANDIFGGF